MPWLGFMRNVNAGPLFYSLGMLPLENELSARPLRSIAAEVRARHGDVALELVFRGEARAVIPADANTLEEVLQPEHFAAGEARVRLSYVLEPYRGELLAALRAGVDEDVARIVDVVRRGATFFVTPEGFYSTDGRMRPLKGIVDHLLAVATPWFAAIAFDPFRGKRLSMLYRIVRPADLHDLRTSLAATRPVTTSALLATWLLAVGLPFDAHEAADGVARLRDSLPPNAFVDPELARDADACVNDALDGATRRGILARDGARYRLAKHRTDARFPGVADVVAYQAAFLDETIAALRRLGRASSEDPPALRTSKAPP
jgi:hypothetical protein